LWISLLVTSDIVVSRFGKQSYLLSVIFGTIWDILVTMTPVTPNAAGSSSSPTAETSDRSSNSRRNNNKDKKNKNKSSGLASSSYVGKCSDIKDHVYDVSAGRSGFDVFVKTTREISEYAAAKLKDASEFRNAMDPDNLGFEVLAPPEDLPDNSNIMQVEVWKVAYKEFTDASRRRSLLNGQVFTIVMGQCSPTIIDRLKASATWNAINASNDLMGLLRLIRTSMYTGATSKNSLHSLLEAQNKFFSFRQTSRMTNADYLRNYTALADQVVHLHGDFGTDAEYVTERIEGDNGDPLDVVTRTNMILLIREEYLAMRFFVHADPKRFGPLIANAQNDFVGGVDKYPKTISKAYDMLVNYVSPTKLSAGEDQDTGMSFFQEDNGRGSAGRGNGGRGNGGGRGRGGGRGSRNNNQQSTSATDEANHATVDDAAEPEDQDVGGANNNSTNNNAYFDASFSIVDVEQLVLMHGLPLLWLLIDSCSTTDIFANASLLSNIHTATKPIWVRCNAGRIQLTQQGYFGNYPHPVWYNPKGVANILSLANVTKHYRVTMDSANNTHRHVCTQE
jgi:hypothetical protein